MDVKIWQVIYLHSMTHLIIRDAIIYENYFTISAVKDECSYKVTNMTVFMNMIYCSDIYNWKFWCEWPACNSTNRMVEIWQYMRMFWFI